MNIWDGCVCYESEITVVSLILKIISEMKGHIIFWDNFPVSCSRVILLLSLIVQNCKISSLKKVLPTLYWVLTFILTTEIWYPFSQTARVYLICGLRHRYVYQVKIFYKTSASFYLCLHSYLNIQIIHLACSILSYFFELS